MTETVECVVIGAGAVGLAVAREMAQSGVETVVLEREKYIGTGTSSRNSEVIHAGIYYPQGSLKATLCVAGRRALYDYCDSHQVDYRRCGKLIVATAENQLPELDALAAKAMANGVGDIVALGQPEALDMEPALNCVGALLSPSTGILDSHAYMLSLQGDIEAAGGMLAFDSPFASGTVTANGTEVTVGGATTTRLRASYVINSAGLYAQEVASTIAGIPAASIPGCYYAKGNYYALQAPAPFSRLVYPVPEPGGLGVHLTLDLGGQAKFGPDVEWVEALDYNVDPSRADRFYGEIRRYWPALPEGSLAPSYAGIRPKLQGAGSANQDFVIQDESGHGVPGLINLYGIESPGLTASLAIASVVRKRLLARA